jgi:serine/threonine protein kinase
MTPEEWQRVRPILESALELDPLKRSSFLDAACPDPTLRSEVESLIAADEQGRSGFLQSPPVMRLIKGTRLGEYEVQSMLGAGGMGEVYRARDLRLRRDVAIKVLPTFVSSDHDRLRRFEQEATATAALNHPNILAVYQMGTWEGAPYLVSEMLEGETLREHMRRGRLPVRKAVEYGVQIARGLAVAHEKGVVHRDLKPENLFVTKDGRVKILDFGLAKLTRAPLGADHSAPESSDETGPGVVLGTTGYMSPEQVRGQVADRRADIFAFGAIVFEMLTGKRAFEKPSPAETMAAIVNEDVPHISGLEPNAPPGLQLVVQHCLEKNPDQRFQSMPDLAFALEALSDPAISPSGAYGTPRRRRLRNVAVMSVPVIVVAAVFTLWTLPHAVPYVGSVTQLTNDAEPKEGGLATDGTRIYFNEGESGSWRIAQVSANGGKTATIDTKFPNLQIADMAPDNSTLLALVGGFREPYSAWLLPLPAGEPRRLGAIEAQDASFFPDGRIVFAKGVELYVAEKDGSSPHKLLDLPRTVWSPSVSPDGKRVVFDSGSLEEITEGEKAPHSVLHAEWKLVLPCCAKWTPDGKYILFQAEQEGRSDLWALAQDTGIFRGSQPPVRLTQGPLSYTNAIPSRDGKQIFAIGSQRRGELVRYDAKSRAFVPYLSGISATDATFSEDGEWVAYLAYPDHTLWRSRTDGSDRLQLTYPPATVIYPFISPDGRKVVFGASNAVYIVSTDGGTPQKVAEHSIAGSWSPDGNLLVLTSTVSGKHESEESTADLKSIDLRQTKLQTFNLRNGKISLIPDSQGKVGGFWVTQDSLLAATEDSTKFLLFDFKTQKWTEFASGTFVNWFVPPSHKYLYCTTGGDEPGVLRIRFADRRVGKITSLKSFRRVVDATTGTQVGVTPEGSVLLTRDIGLQEIYALSVKWP